MMSRKFSTVQISKTEDWQWDFINIIDFLYTCLALHRHEPPTTPTIFSQLLAKSTYADIRATARYQLVCSLACKRARVDGKYNAAAATLFLFLVSTSFAASP